MEAAKQQEPVTIGTEENEMRVTLVGKGPGARILIAIGDEVIAITKDDGAKLARIVAAFSIPSIEG